MTFSTLSTAADGFVFEPALSLEPDQASAPHARSDGLYYVESVTHKISRSSVDKAQAAELDWSAMTRDHANPTFFADAPPDLF